MAPVPAAPTLDEPDARPLEGCVRPPGAGRTPGGPTVREPFGEDLAAGTPLPAERLDEAGRGRREAGREGRVRVDGSPCLAGSCWHGRDMVVGAQQPRGRAAGRARQARGAAPAQPRAGGRGGRCV